MRVVLAVVVGVALVVGGLAGFFTMQSGSSSSAAKEVVQGPAKEVALATESNPGPLRYVGGVPSGFYAGTSGAIAAAGAYVDQVVSLTVRPDATARTSLMSMTTSAGLSATMNALPTLRLQLNSEAGTTVRSVPLGTRIVMASKSQASIEVWTMVMLAKPSGVQTAAGIIPTPTEAAYATISVDLVRADNDWKLAGLRSAEGPSAATTSKAPSDAENFARDLGAFTPFQYVPSTQGDGK
ncbi:MAG: hypothetical protein ACOYN3_09310 [Acidimicrobiia bacterium]